MITHNKELPLPDFLIKDEEGNLTEDKLKKWMQFNSQSAKVSRAKSKSLSKTINKELYKITENNKKISLIYFSSDIRLRHYLYFDFIKAFVDERGKNKRRISLFNAKARSIDLVTLNNFQEGFYLKKATADEIKQFTDDTQHTLDKKHKTLDERTLHLWSNLKDSLEHFEDFDSDKQKLVIMVAQCFIVLYIETQVKRFLFDKYPFIADYFSDINEHGDSNPANESETSLSFNTWEEFFLETERFSELALNEGPSEVMIAQWVNLVKASSAMKDWLENESVDVNFEIDSFIKNNISIFLEDFDEMIDEGHFKKKLPISWKKVLLQNVKKQTVFEQILVDADNKIEQSINKYNNYKIELNKAKSSLNDILKHLDDENISYSQKKEFRKEKDELEKTLKDMPSETIDLIVEGIIPATFRGIDDVYSVDENSIENHEKIISYHGFQSELMSITKKYQQPLELMRQSHDELNESEPEPEKENTPTEEKTSIQNDIELANPPSQGSLELSNGQTPSKTPESPEDIAIITDEKADDDIDKNISDTETLIEQKAVSNKPSKEVESISEQKSNEPESIVDISNELEGELLKSQSTAQGFNFNNKEVVDDFVHHINSELNVPGKLIDNIVINFAIKNDLSSASLLLKEIEHSEILTEHLIPDNLIESAYFAQNIWSGNSSSLSKISRLLNSIQRTDITCNDTRCYSIRILPYIAFVATFQPTLFGQYNLNAANLLKSIRDSFSSPELKKLIDELLSFSKRSISITLSDLREQQAETSETPEQVALEAEHWKEKTVNSQSGFAPIRRILRHLIERGEYLEIFDIITKGKLKEFVTVDRFVNKYLEPDQLSKLFNITLKDLSDIYITDNRQYAINYFVKQSNEFLRIASLWLQSARTENTENTEYVRKFSVRFISQLIHTSESLNKKVKKIDQSQIDRIAGINLIKSNIDNLISVIKDNNDNGVWETEFAEISFNRTLTIIDPDNALETNDRLINIVQHLLTQYEPKKIYELSLQREQFDLTYVTLLKMQHRGENIEKLFEVFLKTRNNKINEIEDEINTISRLTDNAVLSDLMEENEALEITEKITFHSEETVDNTKNYFINIRQIYNDLKKKRNEIEQRFDDKLKSLHERYNKNFDIARKNKWIDDSFIELVTKAFDDKDITVLEEFIIEIENSVSESRAISINKEPTVPFISNFIENEDEIYGFVNNKSNANSLRKEIKNKFKSNTVLSEEEQKSLKWMLIKRNSKTPTQMMMQWYEEHIRLLECVGFTLINPKYNSAIGQDCNYKTSNTFSHMNMRIKANEFIKSFPLVNTDLDEVNTILTVTKDWDVKALDEYLHNNDIKKLVLFIVSLYPLTKKERQVFAHYGKAERRTLLLIDPVILTYCTAFKEEYKEFHRIKTFLHLSVPYTYYNPYGGGNQMKPPQQEMRFGRRTEISQLTESANGAAIIYGGRQLGKSTILNEVKRSFHDPKEDKYALSWNAEDSVITNENWTVNGIRKEWKRIYKQFQNIGIRIERVDTEEKGYHKYKEAIESCFTKNERLRVIINIDEVDWLLNVDSKFDFPFIRGLRELVYNTHSRFKVIICGLQNVKRFDTSPNNPLRQLGKSLAVSIMSPSDALELVKTPLASLGYKFETPLVANRILARTNRHPGLIQVVCHQLIEDLSLHESLTQHIGQYKITDKDVNKIFGNSEVQEIIKNRFAITLELDKRYKIIVYSLVVKELAQQRFSVKIAHETAGYWLPELKQMSKHQFGSFLNELVGLGVLRMDKDDYAIRNTNVLKLLGTQDEIEAYILDEVMAYESKDPLEYHRINKFKDQEKNKELHIPSPLTRRDEELISGINSEVNTNEFNALSSFTPDPVEKSTISIIAGSNTLGLFALEKTLSGLYQTESRTSTNLEVEKYKIKTVKESDVHDIESFRRLFAATKTNLKTRPYILLVQFEGLKESKEISLYIDYALKQVEKFKKMDQPSRIIFTFNPKALWNWMSYGQPGMGIKDNMTFIQLRKWNRPTLNALLSYYQLIDTLEESKKLLKFSHGWYHTPYNLGLHKNGDQTNFLQICSKYNISNLKKPQAQRFINESGIDSLPWVKPLINNLIEYKDQGLDEDIISLVLEDISSEYDISMKDTKQVINWLTQISIFEEKVSKDKTTYYIIDEIIIQYLNV